MTSLIGQQWGNYKLTQSLGQGGFAEVYLGEHIHLGSKAAVKVLYTRLDEKGIEQFKQEAVTLTHLPHPHIIRIIDFGFDNNNIPYLIMDFASGGTLSKRHPLGMPVPLPVTVEYIKQVSEALQYAHTNNIIHRDIKPENMLIGQNNTILLSDFGIARVVQTHSVGTAHIIGSVLYMSPEQWTKKVVFASDQYSLGIVAYQWLCGDLPFQGEFAQLMYQHRMEAPPPFPPQLHIPPSIENVVMKALAKDSQQRFATVQEFASTLEQTSRGMPFQLATTQFGTGNQSPGYISPQPQSTQVSTTNDMVLSSQPSFPLGTASSTQFPTTYGIDAFYRQGAEAYAKGDLEQAEQQWGQVLTMDPKYGNGTLAPRMTKLKSELKPIRVKRLREQAQTYSKAAAWNQEIDCWNKLLVLQPQDTQAKERCSLAQHNMQYAWMYTNAQQFVQEGKLDVAKTELTNLWRDARYYPDPAELAPKVGLDAPPDPEEEKAAQQRRQLLEEQERQRQQAQDAVERERRQVLEGKAQDYRTRIERLGGSIFIIGLYLFLFVGGVGTLVGMIAVYWTSQAWILAVATSVILVPIAYVLGYRKVMTLPSMLLPSLLGIASAFGLTWYLSQYLSYGSSEVSHFWFLTHTLWIGRQLTFGLIIGITFVVALFLLTITTRRAKR